jgi:hypothetical protein
MMLHSIAKIQQVYPTGQKPVLVQCDDLEFYVCKHNQGQIISYSLFIELIVHHLLKCINVRVAEQVLVQIKTEHVLGTQECQPLFFKNIPCFATKYLENASEWSQFPMTKETVKQIINAEDIIIVAFMDIWLANEDRNYNNFNLLLNPSDNKFEIIPIDHEACLNSKGFDADRPLYSISYDESIINTPHFQALVKPLLKTKKDAVDLAESLYFRVNALEKHYNEKVIDIPSDWKIPMPYIKALKANIFQEDWLNETKTTFFTFLTKSISLK